MFSWSSTKPTIQLKQKRESLFFCIFILPLLGHNSFLVNYKSNLTCNNFTLFDLLATSSIKRVLIEICEGLLQFTFATRGNIRTLKSTSLACLKKVVVYILNELYVFFEN